MLLLVPVLGALVQGLATDGKVSVQNVVSAVLGAATVGLSILKQFNDAGKAVSAPPSDPSAK